jgi:HEAT repeat protein
MTTCFRGRILLTAAACLLLAGCGNRATREAIEKARTLSDQKQYDDANATLIAAIKAREDELRGPDTTPVADPDALAEKMQSDPEILKLERAEIPLYLHWDRPDLASAVEHDIEKGSPGDATVRGFLHDGDPKMRLNTVGALGLSGSADAIDDLAEATKDSDQDVRRAAVQALGSIKDPKAVDPLLAELNDSYWFCRSEAAQGLAREQDARAVDPLLHAVTDSDSTVENAAENGLLLLCQIPNLPHDSFIAHLNDPNPKLVVISAVCLALLKDKQATPVLEKLADSPDEKTRLHAVKALGESGDPSVIPVLRATLKDPTSPNVRGWSVIGLGKLRDAGSLNDLKAIAADPSQSPAMHDAATAAVEQITGTASDAAPGP